ncbi:MAG: hypothetical protein IIY44_04260 [Erysipelotrichales bacterium]|nr:hypothetical protein [Erysipelotrichales bacterium]
MYDDENQKLDSNSKVYIAIGVLGILIGVFIVVCCFVLYFDKPIWHSLFRRMIIDFYLLTWMLIDCYVFKLGVWLRRKYQLSEEGITIKVGFKTFVMSWKDFSYWAILPVAGSYDKWSPYIVASTNRDIPEYPIDQEISKEKQNERIIIRIAEDRLEEFQQYAEKYNIEKLEKEDLIRMARQQAKEKRMEAELNQGVSEWERMEGISIEKKDFWGERAYRLLGLFMLAFMLVTVGVLIYEVIKNQVTPMMIAMFIFALGTAYYGINTALWKNRKYRLSDEGIHIKTGKETELIPWKEIRVCGVVPVLNRSNNGVYILASTEKKIPKIPLDKGYCDTFRRRTRVLMRCTFVRVSEMEEYAEKNGIRWIECYDEDGKLIVPEGVQLDETKKQS